MAGSSKEPKRRNRTIGVGDALGRIIDPALKKRGFASRDLIAHWGAMVPPPYDKVTAPDRLFWPRGPEAANGAVLYVRCQPAHVHAVAHEGARLTAAINRYFGYVLVGAVKISVEPMQAAPKEAPASAGPDDATLAEIDETVRNVADDGLRDALRQLGAGLLSGARK